MNPVRMWRLWVLSIGALAVAVLAASGLRVAFLVGPRIRVAGVRDGEARHRSAGRACRGANARGRRVLDRGRPR